MDAAGAACPLFWLRSCARLVRGGSGWAERGKGSEVAKCGGKGNGGSPWGSPWGSPGNGGGGSRK